MVDNREGVAIELYTSPIVQLDANWNRSCSKSSRKKNLTKPVFKPPYKRQRKRKLSTELLLAAGKRVSGVSVMELVSMGG